METVKRAIIVAAGEGKRLRPVTLQTPKPLVRVNGTRMIDTSINALKENGIHEIYIVTGYKKEMFHAAFADDPDITVIDNPYYDQGNNITSLYMVRDYLPGAFVMDGDLIIRNREILNPVFERSGYAGTWESETDEWAMKVENGRVVSCDPDGGVNAYRLWSISMWSEEDGRKLAELIRYYFEKKDWSIYWDNVPMLLHLKDFDLGIRQIRNDDIMEIDTLEELAQIDPEYSGYAVEQLQQKTTFRKDEKTF